MTGLPKRITWNDEFVKDTNIPIFETSEPREFYEKSNDRKTVTNPRFVSYKAESNVNPSTNIVQTHERIVEQLEAIVIDIETEKIRIKFKNEVTALFPKSLFSDIPLQYGQHLIYQIKEDKEGYKFQKFIAKKPATVNPLKEKIESVLDSITFDD